MFQPLNDLKILGAIYFVAADMLSGLKFSKPMINEHPGIIVIRVQKAREHSRGRASPPRVINDRPELDKQ
ncbi:hypothetical protein ABIF07_001060 [Bradyrhizobium elkanii]|nr:hypothetical protein [Bradyrhizobium elkanii]